MEIVSIVIFGMVAVVAIVAALFVSAIALMTILLIVGRGFEKGLS